MLLRKRKLGLLAAIAIAVGACSELDRNVYDLEVERKCVGCNLEGVNLAGQPLGARYRIPIGSSGPLSTGPNYLQEVAPVDLTNANLKDANLSRTSMVEVTLTRANLSDANLSNADLSRANLQNADLRNADLQNATLLEADLSNADLRGANLRGADLTDTDLTGVQTDRNTVYGEAEECTTLLCPS